MTAMRAKMEVVEVTEYEDSITKQKSCERLTFRAVCKNGYPDDGSDEDNTYAKWTPQADMTIYVTNPALLDKFKRGQKYYVDFTEAAQ